MSWFFEMKSCRRALVVSLSLAATCACSSGCGSRRTPPPVQNNSSQQAAKSPDESSAVDAPTGQARVGGNGSGTIEPETDGGSNDVAVDRDQLVAVGPQDAQRGSTIAGGGIITEPLKQYFQIQHRLVYMNIQHAEQLYKAEHGRMPRTHEEYMKEIIEANEIELPELKPGWDYYYDSEGEELMQRRSN